MLHDDMQEIQITIEDAKRAIHLGELVTKLESNPDFKELVIEGYFKEDAARVVMLKADKKFDSPEKQANLDKDILGISVFGEYLRTKKVLGLMAQESLTEHENTRQEIMQESI